jgi:hypothetical protein
MASDAATDRRPHRKLLWCCDRYPAEVSRFGNKPLETVAGPTLGTAANLVDLWAKVRSGDDAASSALRLAQNNTPFLNLFYSRIAMDHLFLWSVQEAMNPGSLRRPATATEEVDNDLIVLRVEAESVLGFEIEGVFLLLCGHRGSSPV